jgi:hypothetical protein
MSTTEPLTSFQRALIRACRARLAFVPLYKLAIPFGVTRQRVHQICVGIIPGAGDDLQDDKLRAAHEKDVGRKISDAQWKSICFRIDAELTKVLSDIMDTSKADLTHLVKDLMNVAR